MDGCAMNAAALFKTRRFIPCCQEGSVAKRDQIIFFNKEEMAEFSQHREP